MGNKIRKSPIAPIAIKNCLLQMLQKYMYIYINETLGLSQNTKAARGPLLPALKNTQLD